MENTSTYLTVAFYLLQENISTPEPTDISEEDHYPSEQNLSLSISPSRSVKPCRAPYSRCRRCPPPDLHPAKDYEIVVLTKQDAEAYILAACVRVRVKFLTARHGRFSVRFSCGTNPRLFRASSRRRGVRSQPFRESDPNSTGSAARFYIIEPCPE